MAVKPTKRFKNNCICITKLQLPNYKYCSGKQTTIYFAFIDQKITIFSGMYTIVKKSLLNRPGSHWVGQHVFGTKGEKLNCERMQLTQKVAFEDGRVGGRASDAIPRKWPGHLRKIFQELLINLPYCIGKRLTIKTPWTIKTKADVTTLSAITTTKSTAIITSCTKYYLLLYIS